MKDAAVGVPSFCSVCANGCPIIVDVEDGRVAKVTGDPDGPIHRGYSCHRGRALPELMNSPDRLLHSMKKLPEGTFAPIAVEQAMDEIAAKLQMILDRHGPRSIAHYAGTKMAASAHAPSLADSLMDGIGSLMRFSSNTIDQPGKQIAKGLHGYWLAPPQAFDRPDVILWIGMNPLISYTGLPNCNPGDYFKDAARRGVQIIVIDPRRTETARRANIHLQLRPGEDIPVLAGMLRVILEEDLYDHEFVAANVQGVDELRREVAPFTPEHVAQQADIDATDLVQAARTFAAAKRAYAVAGTGPNMGTARGTLVEYLVLALDTVCGHYLRAGEAVSTPGTLSPIPTFKAQAHNPVQAFGFGQSLRFRGLADTLGGLPVSALAEEILEPGEGQVRALLVLGGNPVAAFPDQLKTIEAMKALDLLVTIDVRMSQTSRLAHYVIAPTMSLEVPRIRSDGPPGFYANGYCGYAEAVAQYSPAIVERPPDSDLLEEWEFYWGLASRLGLSLSWNPPLASLCRDRPPVAMTPPPLDMTRKPTTDELFEFITTGARVPLAEVKKHTHGSLFPPDPPVVVQPKDPGWQGKLDVGNPIMMNDLGAEALAGDTAPSPTAHEFRLLARRMHQINSSLHTPAVHRGRPYNPAFMHPVDLVQLGLGEGDLAVISSERSSIRAVVASDANVRRGVVSMAHCFGDEPDRDADVREIGSPTNRLLSLDVVFEPYSGQPLMSNVPVNVRRLLPDEADAPRS